MYKLYKLYIYIYIYICIYIYISILFTFDRNTTNGFLITSRVRL